jgi:DnaJ-class molecular chaperone
MTAILETPALVDCTVCDGIGHTGWEERPLDPTPCEPCGATGQVEA